MLMLPLYYFYSRYFESKRKSLKRKGEIAVKWTDDTCIVDVDV